MIKVGILGASNPQAGELIRILINHPEIELITAYDKSNSGRRINEVHFGLIGETESRFTDKFPFREYDIVFICEQIEELDEENLLTEGLKVVFFNNVDSKILERIKEEAKKSVGISELFRKPLVRGAEKVKLLTPVETICLIALYPLALHLLLSEKVKVNIKVPEWEISGIKKESIDESVTRLLSKIQYSFPGFEINNIDSSGINSRSIRMETEFRCLVSLDEIEKAFEAVYDDHNFTFVVHRELKEEDVLGTHKCLIKLTKPDDETLKIEAVADAVLRGGAGDAVHSMNLLFGLFEKIGLSFKAPYAFITKN